MANSIITVTQNNKNKIVTVGGQILKAPVNAGNLQETKSYTVSAAGTSTISPDTGYDGMEEVNLTVPIGNVKPVSTISNNQANISSYGTSISLDATISNTPTVVTPGYVSEGSAGNTSILLSATDANFIPGNIKKNVTIFGKTGTYEGSGGSTEPSYAQTTITMDSAHTNGVTINNLQGQPIFIYMQLTGNTLDLYDGVQSIGGYCNSTISSNLISGIGWYYNSSTGESTFKDISFNFSPGSNNFILSIPSGTTIDSSYYFYKNTVYKLIYAYI